MVRQLWLFGRLVLALLAGIVLLALILRWLNPLPSRSSMRPSAAMAPPTDTPLVNAARNGAQAHPGQTGLIPLANPLDSFAARVALVRAAQSSLDVQYYIWHGDVSGRLLLAELIRAADRGVRVRLLIDDNTTAGTDALLAGVARHPHIEVRLFNPLPFRRFRPLAYLAGFPRINRRMHNKSLTADGVATIVGGRNVGDEYFGARQDGLFIDLDMLAVGAVVAPVSASFDEYWNSDSVYALTALMPDQQPESLDALRTAAPPAGETTRQTGYLLAVAQTDFVRALANNSADVTWAPTRLIVDDPAKALGGATRGGLVIDQLGPILAAAQSSLDIVSSYFVPARRGTDLLVGLAQRGVAVHALTNSYGATDVPVVHAGYTKRRDELIDGGVALFEVRAPEEKQAEARDHGPSLRFSGGGESLHAKTIVIDRRQLFVGSFNFDPRSADLNCEMGFLIDSPAMAGRLSDALAARIAGEAWSVTRGDDGDLRWSGTASGAPVEHRTEPGTTGGSRVMVWLLSWLPIEWVL